MLRRVDAEKTAIIADLRRNSACARVTIALRWQRRTSASGWPRASATKKCICAAVSIKERLNSGIDQIMAAREIEGNSPTRPRMASGSPSGRPRRQPKQLDEIEQMIAEAVTEARGETRPATTNSEGQS